MNLVSAWTILLSVPLFYVGTSTEAFVLPSSSSPPRGSFTNVFASHEKEDDSSRDHILTNTLATTTVVSLLTVSLPFVTNAFDNAPLPTSSYSISSSISSPLESSSQSIDYLTSTSRSMSPPSAISSSSMELSEALKVLDMGLPSYDKISTSKTSQEDIDGVTVSPVKAPKPSTPKPTKQSKPKSSPTSNTSRKSSGPTAEEKQQKAQQQKAEKDALRLAKEQKMEEKKSEQMEIVDMGMPTYGTSESKKSVFSL